MLSLPIANVSYDVSVNHVVSTRLPTSRFQIPRFSCEVHIRIRNRRDASALAELYGKHLRRTRAFSVVLSTRLFNILSTVFSLHWLPVPLANFHSPGRPRPLDGLQPFDHPFLLARSPSPCTRAFPQPPFAPLPHCLRFFLSITFLRHPVAGERLRLSRFYSNIKYPFPPTAPWLSLSLAVPVPFQPSRNVGFNRKLNRKTRSRESERSLCRA